MAEESRPATRRGDLLWVILIAVVVSAALTAVIQFLATNPHARRRVVQRAANSWLRFENSAQRGTALIRRRRHRMEQKARELALELWMGVNELVFQSEPQPIPAVDRRLYAHGAWMGAAPALMRDVRWRAILAFLMPDVYRDVTEAVDEKSPPTALIPMFENNPVMCAFGVHRAARTGPHVPCMEWDLFLSTERVQAWEDATESVDRDRIMKGIVDTMVIGHASITDTVQQQLGVCQWADVRKTKKTEMGGVEVRSWLDLFARALSLADEDDVESAIRAMSSAPRRLTGECCVQFTFANEMEPAEAIAKFRRVTGAQRLSVVLEIKTVSVWPELLQALIGALNDMDVHVDSVGSFKLAEIRGVSEVVQPIGDEELPGPREILFLHFAGDLQAACDRGTLTNGQAAMFNGASLLTAHVEDGKYVYGLDETLLTELSAYRDHHELELGIYVQESDLDAEAASLLSRLVADRPMLFPLGFAWGGLADEVALPAGLGDHRGFGSQGLMQRLGVARRWKRGTLPGAAAAAS